LGNRTGLVLAVTGAITAFVAHGMLQLAGIALMAVAAAGLWLRRRPGWTQRRAEAIGSWLTAPDQETAPDRRVPLEDILHPPPDDPSV